MGLRCTVTGHRWSESRSRTEREEGDDEIAVSTVEYEICEVCGEERVVSQNTEVRAKDDGSEMSEEGEESEDTSEEADERDRDSTDETYTTGSGGMGMVGEVDEDDDAVVLESDDGDSHDHGFTRDTDETATHEGGSTTVYVCSCGFESPVHENSLREGDICPSCGKSYLEETERS